MPKHKVSGALGNLHNHSIGAHFFGQLSHNMPHASPMGAPFKPKPCPLSM